MLDEPLPSIEFPEVIRGHGHLTRGQQDVEVDAFSLERKKYDHTSPFVFTAQLRDNALRRLLIREPLQFSGIANTGQPVAIGELYGVSAWTHLQTGAEELRAETEQVDLGKSTLEFEPKEQSLHAFLTDTPFALSEVEYIQKRYDGTTYPTFETPRPPFEWTTSVGTAHLSLGFEREDVKVAGQKSSVRIPRPVVYLTVSDSARTIHPAELTGAWLEELEPLLRLLSFLGRNRVSVARTEVVTVGQQKDPYVVEVYTRWLRGQASSRPSRAYPRPILSPQRMPPSSISSMLARLVSSPYKAAVLLAIGFLVSTYRRGIWIEDSVASAFTALETMVHAISSEEGTDFVLTPKGPRRAPIIGRAAEIFLKNGVEWADLWRGSTDLEQELSDAYDRRSKLMHAGKVDDYPVIWSDFRRVHALTERLVYKLIGGEDAWVDSQAYVHV